VLETGAVSLAMIDAIVCDAVRRVAAADPDPTDPFRGLYVTDDAALKEAAELTGATFDRRLTDVGATLGLDSVDTLLLSACAAPVLDPRYGRLVGYLHDDMTRRLPSPRLLARLLVAAGIPEEQTLVRLAATGGLRHGGAVTLLADEEALPAADRQLKLGDPLAALLLGADLLGAPVDARFHAVELEWPAPGRGETVARVASALAAGGQVPLLCTGPDAEQVLAHALGCGIVLVDAPAIGDSGVLGAARLRATLAGARVVVSELGAVPRDARETLGSALARMDERVLLSARSPVEARAALGGIALISIEVPSLGAAERRSLWEAHVPGAGTAGVAEGFGLNAGEIRVAAMIAGAHAAGSEREMPSAADLWRAARLVSRRALDEHATLLPATVGWDALVLPDGDLEVLHSISARVRHRATVMDDWGFQETGGTGTGVKVLFSGASGTGKTLAAQVIAADLGLEIYRIDLARLVSKFIGETEKNLGRVFDEAEQANAVILFDEADALFGKRSAVSDAHDRYANIEVAYLLQRVEEFTGVVVLTTNLRQNLDQAFLRRLDFAVDFAIPDREMRLRIWQRHLPAGAPVSDEVDLAQLAEHVLSGGSIRNCLTTAAFAAADEGGPIAMPHVESALRLEHRKLGRLAPGRGLVGEPAGNGAVRSAPTT
jgi:hypothetical protein